MTIDLRERSAPSLAASSDVGVRRRGSRPAVVGQHHAMAVIATLSGLGAAFMSDASPAGIGLADALYRGLFAAVIVWFSGRARRWTLPLLAGLAALSTASLIGQFASVLALGFAMDAVWGDRRRNRLVGASVAAVCVPALLSQGAGPIWRLTAGHLDDPFATSAVITVVATLPVLVSGWKTLSRRKRRLIRRRARFVAFGLGLIIFVTLATSAAALPSMLRGLSLSQDATQSMNDGELAGATRSFANAAREWESANSALAAPWMTPSRLVPILGQHVRAAQVVTGQASALSSSAAAASERVDPDELIVDGVVNIEEVDAITPAVDALAATVERATARIDQSRSPWLIPPLAERIDRAVEVLGRSSGLLNASAEGLHVSADLLGRDTPSQVLVMVSTPSEARASGGFVGNWVVLQSTAGEIEVVEQFHARELNALLEESAATLVADDDYQSRYGRFAVERHVQDVTLSPDFPSVAPVAADLFAQATGTDVEAVLMIDPFVIEKLLAFTGPIDVNGDVSLTGANASRELLIEQYERYEDDELGRELALLGLTDQLIEAMIDQPPDPVAFAMELAPLAEQKRISLWLAGDADGSIVDRLGISGSFPESDDGLLAFVHQNAGQNKIDAYLERAIDIRTTLSPTEGRVSHHVTMTLNNTAPSSGLADAVLASNDQGLEPGTNRMLLSLYSSDRLVEATLNGEPAALERDIEFNRSVFTTLVTIGAGDFVVLEYELEGSLQVPDSFEMVLGSQPLVVPDAASWRISTDDGTRIEPPDGWSTAPDGARWAATLDRTESFTFSLGS